jgi:serine/threonine-protein kinase
VSPDGRRLSLDVRDEEQDIWIWDLARETMTRLTDKAGPDQYGLWTPNGEQIVFTSLGAGRNELFWHRSDGVGSPEQITDTSAENLTPFPNAITADGKQVIFRAVSRKNDLFVVDIAGDRKVMPLLSTEHDERNAALSPDGGFMAFESDLSGRIEVYVRPFPDVNSRQWPVSTAGGAEPAWSPTGRELFYVSTAGQMMSVPVTISPAFELGRPVALFDASLYYFGGTGRNYDVGPDGRFVLVRNPGSVDAATPITVVVNWLEEFRARLR